MGVYLAVDACGSRTECVIADDKRVLSQIMGDTIRIASVGAPEATARFRRILEQAASKAGIPLYLVDRACVGLTGLTLDGVRPWAEELLSDVLTGELILTGEDEIALEAAFGEGAGVLVIAGNGSHAVGRCENGSRFTAGDWGPMLGEAGSGHWIGLEGIRSGLRALDRGVPSCLLREIHGVWGTQGVGALVSKANSRNRPDFATLAEAVSRCATQGDALARSVLERAGQELAAQVALVMSKMRAAACSAADLRRVAFAGDVLVKIAPVRQAMTTALALTNPGCVVDQKPIEPIQGALAKARGK